MVFLLVAGFVRPATLPFGQKGSQKCRYPEDGSKKPNYP
jgi:hypothetical protein